MELKYIKLSSGEDVIGQVEEKQDHYNIKQGVQMAVVQNGQLALAPLAPFGKENTMVKLNKNHVMFAIEPNDEIKNVYNSQFGTGIVTASPSIDIPNN